MKTKNFFSVLTKLSTLLGDYILEEKKNKQKNKARTNRASIENPKYQQQSIV